MNDPLGIHVIGLGFGESVVVQMPNGGVGVIDCFAPRLDASTSEERLDANPTLRFLVNELRAPRLAFVAFSHPHEDHGHGLRHVLEHFRGRIDEVWVFRALEDLNLERHMRARIVGGRKSLSEASLPPPVAAGTFATELMWVRNLFRELTDDANDDAAIYYDFAGYRRFSFEGERLTFHVVGPTHRLISEYERDLAENMRGLVDEKGEKVDPAWEPDKVDHDRLSAALVIEYGKTRVVLGGDMIADSWAAVLAEIDRGNEYDLPLSCHMIKASHHGSMTGQCATLYERRLARRSGKPIAVLTPFNRHVHPLPRPEGVNHLLEHAGSVWATNLAEAYHACERLPPDFASAPVGSVEVNVPIRWATDLAAAPALRGVFRASESEGAEADLPSALPFAWRHELIANPRLADLLRPEVRRLFVTREELRSAVAERDCRVSLYFNARGRELTSRRYVGSRAGQVI
jgi:hypothetical protein